MADRKYTKLEMTTMAAIALAAIIWSAKQIVGGIITVIWWF